MVSYRCKLLVIEELSKLGLCHTAIDLGEVEISGGFTSAQWDELDRALRFSGLELMEDKQEMLIEQIKVIIIDVIHQLEEPLKVNFSVYLSGKLDYTYAYLTTLFSASEGCTIEQFIIRHKIERAKELLIYDELTLTEIAFKLHYCNVAHLCSQFRKVTGITSSEYKKGIVNSRRALEEV